MTNIRFLILFFFTFTFAYTAITHKYNPVVESIETRVQESVNEESSEHQTENIFVDAISFKVIYNANTTLLALDNYITSFPVNIKPFLPNSSLNYVCLAHAPPALA